MGTIRLEGPFGAEVQGVDPAHVTPSQGASLRRLLSEHRVLVFRDMRLTPAGHAAFLEHFGRVIVEVDDAASLSDEAKLFGKVTFVTTRPNEYISGKEGLGFHSDFSFYADGAGDVLSLYAIEAEREDPTIFANMILAMQRLPRELAERLRGLEVVKCANFFHNNAQDFGRRYRLSHRDPSKYYGHTASVHPAILRHRTTGEELLNVCQTFTSHFRGLSYAESDRLFAEIEPWQYAEENFQRHRWRPGDLVVWDNLALQHGRAALTGARHLQRVACNRWDIAELSRLTAAAVGSDLSGLQAP